MRPPLALQTVTRARACVIVGVVHRGDDGSVRADDRRRLEIVRRDLLPLHPEHRFRDVRKATLGQRPRDVEAADPLRQHAIARDDVGGTVAVRQIARVEAGHGEPNLIIADRREPKHVVDGLHGMRRA